MTDSLHIYTRPAQPAMRYYDPMTGCWRHLAPAALVWTSCCRRRRRARNCLTQVYFDGQPFWCDLGHGCKARRPRRRVTARTLAREFKRGLSMIGLARKYGLTLREIEARVRRVARRP